MRAKNRMLDQYPMTIRAVSQIKGTTDWMEDFAIDQMEQQLQLAKAKREKRQQAAAMTA